MNNYRNGGGLTPPFLFLNLISADNHISKNIFSFLPLKYGSFESGLYK